jgi:fatty-acyl-CoA synthase
VFTSGTTGAPKGVVLTHAGIVSNAQRVTSRYRLSEGSIWLNTLPLFHVGGSVNMTLGCMCNVGTHVMFPEFNAERTLRSIEEDRASMTMAVPTMIMALAERPELARTDLSSLKVLVTGGTTVPPEIVRLVQEKFGVNLHVVFGQTEAGGVMTQTFPGDTQHHICSTVGQALPQCEMKVINTDTGIIQPLGEVGEICTRRQPGPRWTPRVGCIPATSA